MGHAAGKGFDAALGAKVIAWARAFLDSAVPLKSGNWASLSTFSSDALKNPKQYLGNGVGRDCVLFVNNCLHIEVIFDRSTEIGKSDPLGISDVVIESALTTIMDCEDSVAAVDADDKVQVYRNWLGLMKGDLAEDVSKGGRTLMEKPIGS